MPLLHRWLNAPHVLEWWDRPGPTLDDVREKYLPRLSPTEDFTAYTIRRAARPIGYIQRYRVHRGSWGLPDVGSSVGVDLFIGDRHYLHRGLGPRILRQFLNQVVFRDQAVEACFIDPSSRNQIAVRAFEKAGFRRIGTAKDPGTGVTVSLMRITREELSEGSAD